MTSGIPWPIAYGAATVGMVAVAYLTYWILKKFTDGPGKKIKRR